MQIDGNDLEIPTGLFLSGAGASPGGEIELLLQERIDLINGATLSNLALGEGGVGAIKIEAATLAIDGGKITMATVNGDASEGIQIKGDTVSLIGRGVEGDVGIESRSLGSGRGGDIHIALSGPLTLADGAGIASAAQATGGGGAIDIDAATFTATGGEVSTQARAGGSGDAGDISVTTTEELRLEANSIIASVTQSSGDSGRVTVEAREMTLDGDGARAEISSRASEGSSGDAGAVLVVAQDQLELLDAGLISSLTSSSGRAGSVQVMAENLRIADSQQSQTRTGITSTTSADGDAGELVVEVGQQLALFKGAAIISDTFSSGDAADTRVQAQSLTIDGEGGPAVIGSQANVGSTGDAGRLTIAVQEGLELFEGGVISGAMLGDGSGEVVSIRAARTNIDGRGSELVTGFTTQSRSSGRAAKIELTVQEQVALSGGGEISSTAFADGDAGDITIESGELLISGEGVVSGVVADTRGAGRGGDISVVAREQIALRGRTEIESASSALGRGGNITLISDTLRLDGQGSQAFIGSPSSGAGRGGDITVQIDGAIELVNGGSISSSTVGRGNGGDLSISAADLRLDGQAGEVFIGAPTSGPGRGGDLTLEISNAIELGNGATLSSSALASGDAGTIALKTNSLRIDGSDQLSAISNSSSGAGRAGDLRLEVTEQLILSGRHALIASASVAAGDAGQVVIDAGSVRIDQGQISSQTTAESSGNVGRIEIDAASLALHDQGAISIEAEGTPGGGAALFQPEIQLHVAGVLELEAGAQITAESRGDAAAAPIFIEAGEVALDISEITTLSSSGDGGAISLSVDELIGLSGSRIITSVESSGSGNGGDIDISARGVLLDYGFIQANAPAGAKGGDIRIESDILLAASGLLEVGGLARRAPNRNEEEVASVIQAASPGGEQGRIEITAPELDLSGALLGLSAQLENPVRLAADPCAAAFSGSFSSLVERGRGGLPATPSAASSPSIIPSRIEGQAKPDATSTMSNQPRRAVTQEKRSKAPLTHQVSARPVRFLCGDSLE